VLPRNMRGKTSKIHLMFYGSHCLAYSLNNQSEIMDEKGLLSH